MLRKHLNLIASLSFLPYLRLPTKSQQSGIFPCSIFIHLNKFMQFTAKNHFFQLKILTRMPKPSNNKLRVFFISEKFSAIIL